MKSKTLLRYSLITVACLFGLLAFFLLSTLWGDFWSTWNHTAEQYREDVLAFEECTQESGKIYLSESKREHDLAFCKEKRNSLKTWPIVKALDTKLDDLKFWFGVFVFKSISTAIGSWYTIFIIGLFLGLLLMFYKPAFLQQPAPSPS